MHAWVCQKVGGAKYKTIAFLLALMGSLILGKILVWVRVLCRLPYSGKFWIGANFRTFRTMPHRTKIKSTKFSAFEILIMSNFEQAITYMET